MRFFRSEDTLREWQARQGGPAGETLTPRQVWDLSKLWYHNRLSPDYHGRSPEQAAAIFGRMGLTSPFWQTGR
jgi:hypothetical protein